MWNRLVRTVAAACVVSLLGAAAALGQQSSAQQACINKLNKAGAGVAKAQGKEHVSCLKKAGKGLVTGTVQACLTADPKGKVQKKKDKTTADQTGSCGTAPDFGYTSAAAVNTGAVQGQLDLTADIFGDPIDGAVIDCAADKPGCICQQKALKDVEKLATTKLVEFVKCKKQVLKDGANSASSLEDCVSNAGTAGSIAADTKGKIQKAFDKLAGDIGSRCASVSGAFPADCTSLSGNALATCLDRVVECRVCQTINEMDGLSVNCDLFDDGNANATCASGSGPTPTPTETPTPADTATETETPTPGAFRGALLKTFGRFTYNAVIGIPGSDAECNNDFPGSHTCSYPELLTAEAAGELVGLKDVGNNTVTSFWAIDSTHSNLIQCGVSVPWDYMTAHTGHQGELSQLNNGTGDLTPPVTGLNCLGQSWVGCCM
jgi:hypothetical protein